MKRISIFLLAFAAQQFSCATQLQNAINFNFVSVEMTGANEKEIPEAMRRDGFLPKLQMELENRTTTPLKVELEEGYMMEPAEPGYQALLMTQPLMVIIPPKSKSKQFIYAMCTQLSMSSPNARVKYKVGQKAPDALWQLAKFIAQKNYQGFAAQHAVWSISDGSPILSIDGGNQTISQELQQFVANQKGLDLVQLKRENQHRSKAEIMQAFNGKKADRNIIFKNDSAALVSVGYYSEQGELLFSMFNEVTFKEGRHSIRYNPFPLALAGKRYTVRMTINGDLHREYYFMQ